MPGQTPPGQTPPGQTPPGPSFDSGETLADRFRKHAGASSHLYGYAMRGMADDYDAEGPVRSVCAGYELAPQGAALQLRLLAGVFRLVLTGRAPELVPYYPCLGGLEPASEAWPVLRRVIGDHVDELHRSLEVAPQTNEVGRSAALLAGLLDLVGASGCSSVRLLELGASAGLNLLLDAYCLAGASWRWGTASSAVQLSDAITGTVVLHDFTLVERRGCDLYPVDVTSEEGRLLLTSFVWPFDLHRHHRLAAALQVAQERPPIVDRSSAARWLEQQLRDRSAEPGTLTVVWNSITQMYWPVSEVQHVQRTLAEHGARLQLGHVAMEYPAEGGGDGAQVTTALWQPARTTEVRRHLLGTAHDHGIPVRLSGGGPVFGP